MSFYLVLKGFGRNPSHLDLLKSKTKSAQTQSKSLIVLKELYLIFDGDLITGIKKFIWFIRVQAASNNSPAFHASI